MTKHFHPAALALAPTLALALGLSLAGGACHAAITVVDDAGKSVTLQAPARRVISMSPHVTELLFAAGGGGRVAGAINYSDYPPEAKKIPLVGSNTDLDIERVIALRPDLIIVWRSGNTARQIAQLSRLGVPLFFSEPQRIDDVATSLTRFGRLLGTEAVAAAAAARYRARIDLLAGKYSGAAPVRVFYQIWDKPLYTLNGAHIVSDAIRLCGGVNVFAGLKVIAPAVGVEAVLGQDPEAIFGGDQHDPADAGLNIWKPYKGMLAVKRGNMFTLGGELLTRATPRLADGAAAMCEKLALARRRRG
ncbi:cobalamin-binding protein [Massilia glaciei]|uniref:Cobalamin-binding protein n=1 Tax=Massilia glaciei TaxID=1524097 RepID=A0A2U2I4P0_9BURK|nr:cobalamin-binding protein [Massilia glaciei]PWF54555.1 cobalamin-binding protein [Massilia glaciei]